MKKLIALIVTAAMLVSICVPAVSAADKSCDCGELPTIYVSALGNSDIYANYGTEDEKLLFRPDTMEIIKLVAKLLPATIRHRRLSLLQSKLS